MNDQQHTTHVEWVRAAIRDELGVGDEGGIVEIDGAKLQQLAITTIRETLNWMMAAERNGAIEIRAQGDHQ